MDESELRARRSAAQLLDARPRSAPEVVDRLLAVQAQDLRSARLAVRARSSGLTAADIDRELTEGSLVVGWLLRGTLHMVRREDYAWLHALTAPRQMTGSFRRLGEEGVSPAEAERAVGIVESALAAEGPLTRAELAERLAAAGIRAEGQAAARHLLRLAVLEGVAILGPVRSGVQAYALTREWLGEGLPAVDRERALVTLAERYLAGHAPATADDLAAWAGLPLRDARAALAEIAPDLPPAAEPPPRLLPSFDAYLLGWKDRSFAVPPAHARRVHPGGGVLRATATVDGLAVGTWSLRAGRLELDLFTTEHAPAFEEEAADVERFVAG